MAIHYIAQKDIDYARWDKCISNSINFEVYAFSWFLDAIAGTWDAIVEDDYKAVMPLIYKKKFFSKVIYQHPLIKQLGVFSSLPVKENKIELFLRAIPKEFNKIQICFNRQNTQAIKTLFPEKRTSYYLDLITPYEKLVRSYSSEFREALETAGKLRLSLMKNVTIFEIDLLLHENGVKVSENTIITPLLRIITRLISSGKAEIAGIYGPENSLYSIACFISSYQNVVLLYAKTLQQGVRSKANYMILDNFLKTYSGRNVTLRLEHFDSNWNSELYTSFGALKSYCYCYHQNNLPWPPSFMRRSCF